MSAADDYPWLAQWQGEAQRYLAEIDRLRAIETALRDLVAVDEAINWDDQPHDQWCDAIDAARSALGMPVSA